ncbi:MAG: hypothetical protein WCI72_02480 [archaeon]
MKKNDGSKYLGGKPEKGDTSNYRGVNNHPKDVPYSHRAIDNRFSVPEYPLGSLVDDSGSDSDDSPGLDFYREREPDPKGPRGPYPIGVQVPAYTGKGLKKKVLEPRAFQPGIITGGLERTSAAVALVGLVGGAFFISTKVTGNVISNLSTQTSSWIGGVLVFVGIVAGLFWLKNRK